MRMRRIQKLKARVARAELEFCNCALGPILCANAPGDLPDRILEIFDEPKSSSSWGLTITIKQLSEP